MRSDEVCFIRIESMCRQSCSIVHRMGRLVQSRTTLGPNMSPPSTSWVSAERLPLELYFGAGLLFSLAFCIFNSIQNKANNNNNNEQDGDGDEGDNDQSNKPDDYKPNSCCLCCKVTCGCLKILCKLAKCCKICKKCKKSRTVDIEGNNLEVINGKNPNSNDALNITTFSYNKDFINMGGSNCELRANCQTSGENTNGNKKPDIDRQKSSYRHYSFNVEEESLTQIVIAQIEHSNKQQSKEIEDQNATSETQASEPKEVPTTSFATSNPPKLIDQSLIEGKVDVTSSMVNQTYQCDPIYDVPANKSLVNLNSSSPPKDNPPTDQLDQPPLEVCVVHTSSSPNIILECENHDETTIDTPSIRSLAI